MPPDAPQIRTSKSFNAAIHRITDIACVVAGLHLASDRGQHLTVEQFSAVASVAACLYLIASELTGNYRNWRGARFLGELTCAWTTWAVALISVVILGALTQYGSGLTRFSFTTWTVFSGLLIGTVRSALRTIQSLAFVGGIATRGFAIAGVTDLGIRLAQNIERSPQLGLTLTGFYDDRPEVRTGRLPPKYGDVMGALDDLVSACRDGSVSVVYITFPMRAEDRIRDVLEKLSDSTASVYIVPDFFVFELLHSRWNNILGIPVVSVFENPFYGVDGIIKRVFDLVVGCLLLMIAALPMLAVAALVRFTSPGPVFFRQKRYGLDGKEILVWKFRSMSVCEDGNTLVQATQDDARVTPIGAILRRTSLDELPQLFNVITGRMSLVGPRPHANAHNEEYRSQIQGYMLRHKVKPGITGLAQVSGWRGETDELYKMEKRIECDHQYIRDWTLWLDLKILVRTLFVVLGQRNAH